MPLPPPPRAYSMLSKVWFSIYLPILYCGASIGLFSHWLQILMYLSTSIPLATNLLPLRVPFSHFSNTVFFSENWIILHLLEETRQNSLHEMKTIPVSICCNNKQLPPPQSWCIIIQLFLSWNIISHLMTVSQFYVSLPWFCLVLFHVFSHSGTQGDKQKLSFFSPPT